MRKRDSSNSKRNFYFTVNDTKINFTIRFLPFSKFR